MKDRMGQGITAIHLAVLLFGVAGLFGKFLTLSPILIVFGRTLFASICLIALLPLMKTSVRLKNLQDIFGFLLMGGILAVHWVSFFHSIQISTVAIGLLTFSSFPIFVTFLEPLFFRQSIRFVDLLTSGIVFIGLALVIPDFDFSNNLTRGAFWGVVSGFTFALLSILNRKFVAAYPALTVALYQDAIACTLLLPFAGKTLLDVSSSELWQLILLGVVFTALAHTLFIRGMLTVKAQLAGIITCLEPVYGILLALLLFNEVPTLREVAGGVIIIGTIVWATGISKRKETCQRFELL